MDEYGEYLRADFAQFYGLNIDDVWSGSLEPGHACSLAEQLKLIPDSRVRALWLGTIEYVGWSPLATIMANLFDLLTSFAYSFGGKAAPKNAFYPRPVVPAEVKPVAISDFSVDAFMRQL
jgi:hypothetical protein